MYLFVHPTPETRATMPVSQVSPETADVKWNADLLMQGAREGFARQDFIAQLEQDMDKFLDDEAPSLL